MGALFIMIQFGYYPWGPELWVPNPYGYPRVIPKKNQNFEPNPKIPMKFRQKPNPYPNFGSGSGITLGYPNFGYPILALMPTNLSTTVDIQTT